VIPDWTKTGSGFSGQFVPGTQVGNFTHFSSLSNGDTSAFASSNINLEQTVAPTVQNGVTYTLQVDIGWRNDAALNAAAFLLVNGNQYNGVFTAVKGGWVTETILYTGTSADAGKPIMIDLRATGFQGNFDNVRLHDSLGATLPEPSFTGLLAACFAGLAAFARRKRA
jgi:hypothetical protein